MKTIIVLIVFGFWLIAFINWWKNMKKDEGIIWQIITYIFVVALFGVALLL